LNKGPDPLQRGDNHKNEKMGWGFLKTFSRTTGPGKLRFISFIVDQLLFAATLFRDFHVINWFMASNVCD
jgi:hypothetical protein